MRLHYLLIGLLLTTAALGAPEDKKDAAPAGEPVQVTVAEVTGQAQWMDAAAEEVSWTTIKKNDVLSELVVIRTGLRSSVILKLEDRSLVTIRSGTKIGIAEARRSGASAKTRLGLKYGSIRAKVDSTAGPSDFQVSTPVATLSVRGSVDDFSYGGDNGAKGESFAGLLKLQANGRSQTVNPGEQTTDKLPLPILAIMRGYGAPMGMYGMTPTELLNYLLYGQGRGIFGFGGRSRLLWLLKSRSRSMRHQEEYIIGDFRGQKLVDTAQ
jgi:hypothetical protein